MLFGAAGKAAQQHRIERFFVNVVYRELTEADLDSAIELARNRPGVVIPQWQTKAVFARALSKNPGMSVAAWCCDSRRLVGCVFGGDDGYRIYVHHLAVDEEYLRKGIGGELIREFCQRARKNALCEFDWPKKVMGTLALANVPAERALKRSGFQDQHEKVMELTFDT